MSRQRSGSTVKANPLPVVTSRARTPLARPPCRTLSRMPPSWLASPTRRRRSSRESSWPNSFTTVGAPSGRSALGHRRSACGSLRRWRIAPDGRLRAGRCELALEPALGGQGVDLRAQAQVLEGEVLVEDVAQPLLARAEDHGG